MFRLVFIRLHSAIKLISLVLVCYFSLLEFCSASELELNPEGIPKSFRHILTSKLATFKAPQWMQKEYPYYLSGYDKHNRPSNIVSQFVWVFDLGEWDVRKIVRKGGKDFEIFDKYLNQAIYRVLASRIRNNTENSISSSNSNSTMQSKKPVTPNEYILFHDFKNVSVSQVNSIKTVRYLAGKLKLMKDGYESAHVVYCMNVNFVGEMIFKLVKPIVGHLFKKAEVYGTDKEKWMPILQKRLLRDQVPPEYGGFPNFKPAIQFG